MWKKDEISMEPTTTQPNLAIDRAATAPRSGSGEAATIGRSITLRGDVTGDEDLVIQGRVEGSVDLREHAVTVGADGEVIASIVGRVVTVEGRVEGNIDGGEQVTLRTSAFVQGDITAPRVVLENGARFRGLVDMGEADDRSVWMGSGTGSQTAVAGGNGRAAGESVGAKGPETRAGQAKSAGAANSPSVESVPGENGTKGGNGRKDAKVEAEVTA